MSIYRCFSKTSTLTSCKLKFLPFGSALVAISSASQGPHTPVKQRDVPAFEGT